MAASRWKKLRDSLGQLAALAALVGGCLVVSAEFWPRWDRWHQGRLADELAARVAALPDDQVKVPLRQLASIGTPALGRLVEAAASTRDAVAHVAQHEIEIAFSAASMQLQEEATPQTIEALVELSTALAAQVANFGPEGQRWVERLTLRIVELSDQLPPDSAVALLGLSSRVLERIPARAPRIGKIESVSIPPSATESPLPIDLAVLAGPSERVLTTPSVEESVALPLAAAPAEASSDDEPVPAPEPAWDPKWLGVRTIPAPVSPPPLAGDASLAVTVREDAAPAPIDVPTPLDFKRMLSELRRLSTEELLVRLGAADRFGAGAIGTVLTERGIDAVEAETAARIKSTDEAGRLQMVAEVSRLPAAAARRLLRLLLTDASPEVRLRSLTALATTNDPDLPELARTIAVEDKDPRVADLATKLLRQ